MASALQGYIQRVAKKKVAAKVRKSISRTKRGMKPGKKGC